MLLKLKLEHTCTDDERLAGTQQLEQRDATTIIRQLHSEIKGIGNKGSYATGQLLQLTKRLLETKVKHKLLPSDMQKENASEQQSSEEHKSSGSESGGSAVTVNGPDHYKEEPDQQILGMSALVKRISKFS